MVLSLFCFIVWTGVVNKGKAEEAEKAEKAYAEKQVQKKEEQNSGQAVELKLASEKEKEQWYLKLVNGRNPMQEKDVPEVASIPMTGNEYQIDARILEDLEKMLKDAEAAGRSPMICSAFRAWDTQVALHQNKIDRLKKEEGLDDEEAAVKVATVVARPGTSEHQIGLAVDIVSSEYTNLDEEQMKTKDQKWLMENCRNMDSYFAIRWTKARLQASSSSRGIIGMWGKRQRKK